MQEMHQISFCCTFEVNYIHVYSSSFQERILALIVVEFTELSHALSISRSRYPFQMNNLVKGLSCCYNNEKVTSASLFVNVPLVDTHFTNPGDG
jgi:hypothetical protein